MSTNDNASQALPQPETYQQLLARHLQERGIDVEHPKRRLAPSVRAAMHNQITRKTLMKYARPAEVVRCPQEFTRNQILELLHYLRPLTPAERTALNEAYLRCKEARNGAVHRKQKASDPYTLAGQWTRLSDKTELYVASRQNSIPKELHDALIYALKSLTHSMAMHR